MATKVASLFAEIAGDTSKLDSSLKNTKGKLGGFKTGLNDVVKDLTGFNASTLSVAAGVAVLANGLKDSIDQYYAYTESIQKMADSTGMATDQISRIVQVADDFRVEQSTVETAMKMALQNGFNPTIENLAKLSDQYNATIDPTQRAAAMQKIFGRQWAEMVPLLAAGGQAIRDGAASIGGAMVVTEQAAQKAKEYYAATDALNDAFTNLKYAAAQNLIPALTNAAVAMNTLMTASERIGGALDQHNQEMVNTSKSYAEYRKEMERAAQVAGRWDVDMMTAQMEGLGAAEEEAARNAGILTEAQYNAAKGAQAAEQEYANLTKGIERHVIYSEMGAKKAEMLMDAVTNVGLATDPAAMKMRDYLDAIQKTGQASDVANESMKKFTTELLFQKAAAGLSEEAALKLAVSMGLVDEKTVYATGRLDEMKKNLAQTGDLETYIELVNRLATGLGAIQSKKVYIDIYYREHGRDLGGKYGGEVDLNAETETKHATGGAFTIPPGYPNDSFYLGAGHWGQSGERVTVTPANEVASQNTSNVTYNIFTRDNPGTIKNGITLSRLMGGAA